MKYEDLLKDPRWQKRRLEIMQRDNFTCQRCGSGLEGGIPLNVHHLVYRKCNPWEYYDYELVTLCENCHKELHKKKSKTNEHTQIAHPNKSTATQKESKKIIFYRGLLKSCNDLTPNEKILYSFLLQNSIINVFGFGSATEKISYDGNLISLTRFNNSFLAGKLHLTRNTIIQGFEKFERLGYIENNGNGEWKVFVSRNFIQNGYFELNNIDKLSGDLAIFYSYLIYKGQKYNNTIDTMKYKLAEDMGKTKVAITKLLNRLYKLGLAERLDNGKLLIK